MMDTNRRVYVLTLTRPWAWAVIYGGKDVENRNWRPREQAVSLLIHAGRDYDWKADAWLRDKGLDVPPATQQPGRVIIGRVEAERFVRGTADSVFADEGCWNWLLTKPKPARRLLDHRGVPGMTPAPEGWERAFRRGKISLPFR